MRIIGKMCHKAFIGLCMLGNEKGINCVNSESKETAEASGFCYCSVGFGSFLCLCKIRGIV